jgi:serine/threonine protein kinase
MDYFNKYTYVRTIGQGSFGKKYTGEASLVKENSSGEYFISKKILTSCMSDQEIKKVQQEALLMQKFFHPNIVQYKESYTYPSEIIIVMENCPGGDLEQLINYHKKTDSYFPENTIIDWLAQLISALNHIHSLKIIHRDIKPSNIFITEDGKLKFGDFGVSKLLENTIDQAYTQIGTPLYMSPEVCENLPYTNKSDIWSLGCVLYEMATFSKPFIATSFFALALLILESKPNDIGNRYSDKLKYYIDLMLEKKPDKRPTSIDLMNMVNINYDLNATVPKYQAEDYDFPNLFSGGALTLTSETVVNFKKIDKTCNIENYEDDFESVKII